jgi:FecR protein/Outer membrane protein beta-barrel domain
MSPSLTRNSWEHSSQQRDEGRATLLAGPRDRKTIAEPRCNHVKSLLILARCRLGSGIPDQSLLSNTKGNTVPDPIAAGCKTRRPQYYTARGCRLRLGGLMKVAVARDARASLGISAAFLSLLSAGTALAQTNIGSAVLIERDVSGTFAGQTRSLAVGDGVVSNENIKTASASSTRLQFLDQTNLTIGPTSSVVLDRFVYNPDRSVRAGTVEMAIGAARWVGSGTQPDDAYKVKTPHAVIGVRGTVFDLVVETRRTIVTLREGAIVVCLVHHPQRCVSVTVSGSVVVVTATEIRGPTPNAPSRTQFADNCLSPTDRRLSLCATEALATSFAASVGGTTPTAGPWSGFYVGANIGYGWGNFGSSAAVDPFTLTSQFPFIFPGGSSSANARLSGLAAGLELGYNWRFATGLLAGVETDIQAAGLKGSALGQFSGMTSGTILGACITAQTCTYTNTTDITAKLSWFGTARGRAGAEMNGLWLYATGGLAYGQVSVSGTDRFTVTPPLGLATPVAYTTPINYSVTKVGWAAGAGIEGRVGLSQWTWKVEYLHIDLGTIGPYSFGSVPTVTIDTRITDEIARIGFNYPLSN